jgi:RNA polymerase sigma factor (sigma-70 family)
MDTGPISGVLRHVQQLAAVDAMQHLSDGQLLERYLADRHEAAFAVLLHRHGPMIWRVCQRSLRHRHNAEDVFQATFLTLARKASSIRKAASVACWLHGVAYRLSRRLQDEIIRERLRETPSGGRAPTDPVEQASGQELHEALDEELARLPDKYRAPLVLCYLEGKTQDEAAVGLGWSLSTLKRRLERGRQLLAARLRRRGLGLGVALVGAVLIQDDAWALVAPTMVTSICKIASRIAAGTAVAEMATPTVTALTEGMVQAMLRTKIKYAAALLLTVVLLFGGVGFWTNHLMQVDAAPPAQLDPATKQPTGKTGKQGDLTALVNRGAYLTNEVARCGDCHTPRDARGKLDMSRHLQGAPIWFTPKVKPKGEWENRAPDITISGKAAKWSEEKMTKFLSTGEKSDAPMPAYRLSVEDARAVSAYLRSLPGNKNGGARREKDDD